MVSENLSEVGDAKVFRLRDDVERRHALRMQGFLIGGEVARISGVAGIPLLWREMAQPRAFLDRSSPSTILPLCLEKRTYLSD